LFLLSALAFSWHCAQSRSLSGFWKKPGNVYCFVVVGYLVMPEHIHLLISEPEVGTPSTVMQVLKQRTAHALLPKCKRSNPRQRRLFGEEAQRRAFWQARFYDFNVARRRSACRS
jgi:REP element-mobilizing transposase RayT